MAIALPSFLNQANKAKHAEAKTYVGSLNRGQQAHFLEYGTFTNITDLGIGIPTSTDHYTYDSIAQTAGIHIFALSTGTPISTSLNGYTGKVWIESAGSENVATQAILCEQLGSPPNIGPGSTNCP